MKSNGKNIREALDISLNQAEKKALELYGEMNVDEYISCIHFIENSLDSETHFRRLNSETYLRRPDSETHLRPGLDSYSSSIPLKFQQFHDFYTCDYFFDPLDMNSIEDIDNASNNPTSKTESWSKMASKRLACFALLRISDGKSAKCSNNSPEELLGISLAAIDAWQAIALAQAKADGHADNEENKFDYRGRMRDIIESGVDSRQKKLQKMLAEVGRLCDECRENSPKKITNQVIAGEIHDQVKAYADKIGYSFQTKSKEIGQRYFDSIVRMVGKARPTHKK